ncbi:MAG TPA: hypothetical protein VFS43_10915 [Polyangiaceae bacterium]|nr:hypothetical protein [Polyangiaceae bacterium]
MKAMQCLTCGAPLSVGPGQRYVTCEFCGSTIDVGSRTVLPRTGLTNVGAAATAHAPYPRPAYPAAAPPARSGAKVALALVGVVGALFVFGASAGVFFFLSSSRPTPAVGPAPGGVPRLPVVTAPKTNYFHDATPALAQIKARFGPRLLLKSLVVYDEYVVFTAQNPAKPDDLDSYTLRNGSVDEGRPQKFVGDRRKLEAELFSIDEIPFGSLAGLGRDALARFQAAGVSEGKVSHIIIERENFGRGPGVILRPYVSSERRGGGYVEYDLRGNVKRMAGPS